MESIESIVWEVAVPEVTVEELLVAQGADPEKHSPRPAVVEINRRMLEEATRLAQPKMIWQEVQVAGVGEEQLFLEKGPTLTSKLLVRVVGKAEKLFIYAMTVGNALEERITEYNKAGKMMEAFTLDSAGSAILTISAHQALEEIADQYKKAGLSVTFTLGPGHSYWKGLEDLREIVTFLQADKIGINLTDSNLMLPRKSLAFVMGVGKNLPDFTGKTHCDFCSLKQTCNMRDFGGDC